jgi:hypothetical protein
VDNEPHVVSLKNVGSPAIKGDPSSHNVAADSTRSDLGDSSLLDSGKINLVGGTSSVGLNGVGEMTGTIAAQVTQMDRFRCCGTPVYQTEPEE